MGRNVTQESVAIAINRLNKKADSMMYGDPTAYIGDVSIQSGLTIVSYAAADFIAATSALEKLHAVKEFYIHTQGIWHAGFVARTEIIDKLEVTFEKALRREDDLAGVTVRLRPGHEPVIGVCAYIIGLTSQHGVNLEEVLSVHDEITMIMHQRYAFDAANSLLAASTK